MTDAGPAAWFCLGASADGLGDLVKLLVFLAIVIGSIISSASKRRALARAAEQAQAHEPAAPQADQRSPHDEVPDTDDLEPAPSDGSRPMSDWMEDPAPAPIQRSTPPPQTAHRREAPPRRGAEGGMRRPASDDGPGAHSTHDPVRSTEIGADRGPSTKRPGDHPTAAATVAKRGGISGHDLLRSNDLRGRDRVRAGILWAEVFGPPRSRRVRSRAGR